MPDKFSYDIFSFRRPAKIFAGIFHYGTDDPLQRLKKRAEALAERATIAVECESLFILGDSFIFGDSFVAVAEHCRSQRLLKE